MSRAVAAIVARRTSSGPMAHITPCVVVTRSLAHVGREMLIFGYLGGHFEVACRYLLGSSQQSLLNIQPPFASLMGWW